MIKPLFVIVHEKQVPLKSFQAQEIARIKREERWVSANEDLSLTSEQISENGMVYVCGAYKSHCVLVYFTQLRKKRGLLKGTVLYEKASISVQEAFDCLYKESREETRLLHLKLLEKEDLF